MENCSYCIQLAIQLKFSMINIGGNDLYEGNRKLLLCKWKKKTLFLKNYI